MTPTSDTLFEDFVAGFQQRPKRLPSKYFYDAEGSRLFDAICELPEYYPTRTEIGIMATYRQEIAQAIGPEAVIVEYGSGSGEKTRHLLSSLERPRAYIPVEISQTALGASVARLREAFPGMHIDSVCADYTQPVELPEIARQPDQRRVVYFPGSTIGNFPSSQAREFLHMMREQVGRQGSVLIGIDLRKDPAILHAAYNDAAGVTAKFNKNIVARINRELGTAIDLEALHHYAPYNPVEGRIEMYLYSDEDQVIQLGDHELLWAAGESVLTEYSNKYKVSEFAQLARGAGLELKRVWTDEDKLFGVLYLEPLL